MGKGGRREKNRKEGGEIRGNKKRTTTYLHRGKIRVRP